MPPPPSDELESGDLEFVILFFTLIVGLDMCFLVFASFLNDYLRNHRLDWAFLLLRTKNKDNNFDATKMLSLLFLAQMCFIRDDDDRRERLMEEAHRLELVNIIDAENNRILNANLVRDQNPDGPPNRDAPQNPPEVFNLDAQHRRLIIAIQPQQPNILLRLFLRHYRRHDYQHLQRGADLATVFAASLFLGTLFRFLVQWYNGDS